MQSSAAFKGEIRQRIGKGGARTLRREGKIPAILYASGSEPVAFAMPERDFRLEYHKGGLFTKVVSITIDGKEHFALAREVQTHPVTDQIEHADFQKVDEKTEIRVHVPVRTINADKSAGIKRGGVLNLVRHTIEFFCRPNAIPRKIEIDLANTNIGDSIHISSVPLPDGVRPVIQNRDFTIATIAGRMAEEEIPTAAPSATEAQGSAAAAATTAGAAAPAADKGKDKK